jgi:hypothetical protein
VKLPFTSVVVLETAPLANKAAHEQAEAPVNTPLGSAWSGPPGMYTEMPYSGFFPAGSRTVPEIVVVVDPEHETLHMAPLGHAAFMVPPY